MSEIDYAVAINQKCRACIHFRPGEGKMGTCKLIEQPRHERYWCDRFAG